MKKNIYDILNEVEIDLSGYTHQELAEMEKKRMINHVKKSIKKNNPVYKKYVAAASIALLMIGLLTTNLGNTVWAHANGIVYDITSFLGIEKDLDKYKTVVNKSITQDGLTVQLNEVILDSDELVVSTTLTANEKLGNEIIHLNSSIYVNGKRLSTDSGSGGGKQLDEHTVEQVMFHELECDSSGDLDIKIVFSDAFVNGKPKSGRWVFEFKTNGDELALDTKEILLDYTFTLEDGQKIKLEKYTGNHLRQRIYYSTKGHARYYMLLRGHDDLGNKIEFSLYKGRNGYGAFAFANMEDTFNDDAKTFSLTPYVVKLPEQNGKLSNNFEKVGEVFTIDLSNITQSDFENKDIEKDN